MWNRLTTRRLGAVSICGLVALTLVMDTEPPGAPEAEGQTSQRPRSATGVAAADGDRADADAVAARVDRMTTAQMQRARAYRSDQVLVSIEPQRDLRDVARAHGVEVLQVAGASGFAAVAVPGNRSIDDLMTALRADPAVRAVLPNGVVRGAADADKLQEDADKAAAKAEERLAAAEDAEATWQALIDAGASPELIDEAAASALNARDKADEAAADAEEALADADARVDLEYRA